MTTKAVYELEELFRKWPSLSEEERYATFRSLTRDQREDLFLDLSSHDQAELILAMPEHERRTYLRILPPDDAADVIQHAPEEERGKLLDLLPPAARREVRALLAYAEDEAGGVMSPRFARLRPDMTVDEAIAYLRLQGRQLETIYYAYVLDQEQHLLGVVSFRELFTAPGDAMVADIMEKDVIAVREDTDQEEVARLFSTYDLVAIPVIDEEKRIKGIVTVDDIVDVFQEEASEDMQKMSGMQALEEPYLETSFWQMLRKRAGWLSVLFVGEMLTATAMSRYEAEIAQAVVLAVFIPLIISSGGNSGSQASTLVIRAMSLGEIGLRDWWKVFRRELMSGIALGSILAVLGFVRVVVSESIAATYGEHFILLGATVGLSLVGVVLFGTLSGSMLPIVLRRFGLDPASASAPLVATMVDVTGLIIYFNVAAFILRGTLL